MFSATGAGSSNTTGYGGYAGNVGHSSIPPNQTLYVRNLNEKLSKTELKRSLYALFVTYGRIMDIVALKTVPARGQAFIVFREVQSATAALRALQNFMFYDKPMHIDYAKSKSDAVSRAEGNFKKTTQKVAQLKQQAKAVVAAAAAASAAMEDGVVEDGMVEAGMVEAGAVEGDDDMNDAAKKRPLEEEAETEHGIKSKQKLDDLDAEQNEQNEPNKLLFVRNLKPETTQELLQPLFQQYPGFVEVRLAKGRETVAFVEYTKQEEATVALAGLHGFNGLSVKYAKR